MIKKNRETKKNRVIFCLVIKPIRLCDTVRVLKLARKTRESWRKEEGKSFALLALVLVLVAYKKP